jgi:hypothetical protein
MIHGFSRTKVLALSPESIEFVAGFGILVPKFSTFLAGAMSCKFWKVMAW